jgi:hypothetical protein
MTGGAAERVVRDLGGVLTARIRALGTSLHLAFPFFDAYRRDSGTFDPGTAPGLERGGEPKKSFATD